MLLITSTDCPRPFNQRKDWCLESGHWTISFLEKGEASNHLKAMATSEETDGSTHGHSRILKPAPREGHVILHTRKHLQKHTEQEGHCFPPKNQSRKFLCKPEVLFVHRMLCLATLYPNSYEQEVPLQAQSTVCPPKALLGYTLSTLIHMYWGLLGLKNSCGSRWIAVQPNKR